MTTKRRAVERNAVPPAGAVPPTPATLTPPARACDISFPWKICFILPKMSKLWHLNFTKSPILEVPLFHDFWFQRVSRLLRRLRRPCVRAIFGYHGKSAFFSQKISKLKYTKLPVWYLKYLFQNPRGNQCLIYTCSEPILRSNSSK